MRSIKATTSPCIVLPIRPTICLLIDYLCTLLVCLGVTWLLGLDVARVPVEGFLVDGKNTSFIVLAVSFEIGVSCTQSSHDTFATF